MRDLKLKTLKIMFLIIIYNGLFIEEVSAELQKCLVKAIKRVEEIRTLPEIKYLQTLDGQHIELEEFFLHCSKNWPHCYLYPKFYYWKSETKDIVSNSSEGLKKHKIRIYCNCLSTFCPDKTNPEKTHGDVAEFYDENGIFMGISVYMGLGKYCSLPYSEYTKINNIELP
jgi:hypothetical protein